MVASGVISRLLSILMVQSLDHGDEKGSHGVCRTSLVGRTREAKYRQYPGVQRVHKALGEGKVKLSLLITSIVIFFLTLFSAVFCVNFQSTSTNTNEGPANHTGTFPPNATINAGRIVGTTTHIASPTGSITVNKFLGIPYAAAPIGLLRFAPPQAPESWASLDAKEFGNSCIQVFAPLSRRNFTEAVFNSPPPAHESEDCLFINVFAPARPLQPNRTPYPVIYWMYGGAWKFGNAGLPWYDGSHFAALEDVIVVTVNYRINVFGLPTSPTISNLTERNIALLDQRAGLTWVQSNIQAFGGNASHVTIFGESAGAFAVGLLLSSYAPGTPRPFRAAIMQSGIYAYLPYPDCDNNNFNAWNNLTKDLDCTTGSEEEMFACVRGERTAEQIKNVQERNRNISFAMACDNITVVSDPRIRLEAGSAADVPVLLGSNTNEGGVYTIAFGNDTDAYFATYFPGWDALGLRDVVLAAYPLGTGGRVDSQTQLQQIATDWNFHCPIVWYGATSSKFNPTYRYIFNASFPNTRAPAYLWPTRYQGAYHSSEIPLVFTSYNTSVREAGTAQEDLSNTMRRAWANFAKNPYQAPLEGWTETGSAKQGETGEIKDVMGFGNDGMGQWGMVTDETAVRCEVWERLGLKDMHR